jgi:hypothetical protein
MYRTFLYIGTQPSYSTKSYILHITTMMIREHKYFPSKRRHGASARTTFLDLPQGVRHRIYLDAGLVSQSPIYLNYLAEEDSCIQEYDPHFPELWPAKDEDCITAYSQSLSHFLDGPLPWPRIQLDRDCVCMDNGPARCECDTFPWQLLYVSNTISNEISAIFYSENHFNVFRDRIGGLAVLGSLSYKAISQITSLSIHLNAVEEEEMMNFDRLPNCHAMCTTWKTDRAFRKEKKWNERTAFKEWQGLWKILSPNINQDRLKLFLTCDMADVELADGFLQPLLQAPILQLRQCSIRLSSGNKVPASLYYPRLDSLKELATLARLNVERLTRQPIQSPFRYGDLPKEIRLQILEYTELVSQFDLAWTTRQPEALSYQSLKSKFYEHRRFQPEESNCCWKCSPMADICSCFLRHGAFSTTCTCWTMPTQFFLVDRKMKDDAELVFYSNNHFLILPRTKTEDTNLGIYDFLTHLPENGLRYLRSLSLGGNDVQ